MSKLTKREVEAAKPEGKDVFLWDSEIPGFGVRVKSSGVRSYVLQYRNAEGRSRRLTIGRHGILTVEQARREARRLLAGASTGKDPSQEKVDRRKGSTVTALCERYLCEYALPHKKPRSIAEDRRLIEKHVLPALGALKVDAVTERDLSRLIHGLRETPYQANRVRSLLSKVFAMAEKWGFRARRTNPVPFVERFKEKPRQRFLSAAELSRLGGALQEIERLGGVPRGIELYRIGPEVIGALRLLLFTGARLNEILTLRWSEVDFEGACLHLADSKTGEKTVYLGTPALEVLASLPRGENPWVIPGGRPGSHLVNLRKPWVKILEFAGLEKIRLHDLRHSFASIAAGASLGLPIIGKLLGHTQAETTQRYAHLADDPLRAAAEEVGKRIAEAMGNKKVVEIGKR
jgi:integrase